MQKTKRPNILFIMADQFRADGVGQSSFSKTPNLDKIAQAGTSFTSCYSNAPVCIPARFCLATGQSVRSLAINHNIRVDLNPHQVHWTNQVKQLGYQTAVIGKTHLHRHNGDLRDRQHLIHSYGFDFVEEITGPRACMKVRSNMTDLWAREGYLQPYIDDYEQRFSNKAYIAKPSVLPNELYADNYVGNAAVQYLKEVDTQSPWFCWVSFAGPHEPWDAPQDYSTRYAGELAPLPIAFNQEQMDLLPKDSLHYSKFQQAPKISRQEINAMRVNYAANISLIDDRIGDIIDVLQDRNCLDNTLIAFTSDHGEMNGDHGLIYKNVLYQQAVKVPLIVQLPENLAAQTKNKQSDALIQMADIGPTILSLIGMDDVVSEKQYAKSFARVALNSQTRHRDYVFSEVAGDIMITDGHWKLVADANLLPYMLFNLSDDPAEQRNLIDSRLVWLVKRRLLREIKKYVERETAIRLCSV